MTPTKARHSPRTVKRSRALVCEGEIEQLTFRLWHEPVLTDGAGTKAVGDDAAHRAPLQRTRCTPFPGECQDDRRWLLAHFDIARTNDDDGRIIAIWLSSEPLESDEPLEAIADQEREIHDVQRDSNSSDTRRFANERLHRAQLCPLWLEWLESPPRLPATVYRRLSAKTAHNDSNRAADGKSSIGSASLAGKPSTRARSASGPGPNQSPASERANNDHLFPEPLASASKPSGSEFQRDVWRVLRTTSTGEVLSYSDLARRVDRPRATRAVANACAANDFALWIPCHRVLRVDGQAGGYRWGEAIKRQLLAIERRVLHAEDCPHVETLSRTIHGPPYPIRTGIDC